MPNLSATPRSIAIFGAGPGLGRAVARRFGQKGFRVALVARTRSRLDALVAELTGDGIDAVGFAADLADRDALPTLVEEIKARLGRIDVIEYAPTGMDWQDHYVDVQAADVEAFEFPLDLLLRTPVALTGLVLPEMLRRGEGAVLVGLAVTASAPYPQLGNVCTAAAAARAYVQNLNVALAESGVYAGLVQVGGLVAGSDGARYVMENWDRGTLPKPLDPADIADVYWDLFVKRDRFEEIMRPAAT